MRKVLLVVLAAAVPLLVTASSASAGTLDQQQTTTSGSANFIRNTQSDAQTFIAGITGGLDRADLHLQTVGTPSDNVTVEIRDASSAGPGSNVLASGSIPPSAVGTPAFVQVGFTPTAPVVAGHQYAIVAYTAAMSPDQYAWTFAGSDLYLNGDRFLNGSSPPSGSWVAQGADFAFKTYVVPAPPPTSPTSATTGQRAAALATCKKRAKKHNWSKKRLSKCRKKANLLPV